MPIIKLTKFFLIILLLSSCDAIDKKGQQNNSEGNTLEEVNPEKSQMEIRFSCGESGINEYLEDGWVILEEYTEEKICTWKSFAATKDCDIDKDKGCKITKPDKIGEERIYLLEK